MSYIRLFNRCIYITTTSINLKKPHENYRQSLYCILPIKYGTVKCRRRALTAESRKTVKRVGECRVSRPAKRAVIQGACWRISWIAPVSLSPSWDPRWRAAALLRESARRAPRLVGRHDTSLLVESKQPGVAYAVHSRPGLVAWTRHLKDLGANPRDQKKWVWGARCGIYH